MSNNLPTVFIDHITKTFGEFTAVSDLSLAVYPGRIFGLLGPNGAGKTTTIRMIVNITAPDSGRIEVFGRKITPELQDRIGYLPEERGLYRKMKVVDQIKFFAALKNIDGKEAEQRRPLAVAPEIIRLEKQEGPATCRRGCSRRSSSSMRSCMNRTADS